MILLLLALLLLAAGAVSAHHIPGGDVVTGSRAIGPVPEPYTAIYEDDLGPFFDDYRPVKEQEK